MPLTSETYIDKVEILADGQIQVREVKVILEDGKEISKANHRYVLDPAREDAAAIAAKVEGKDTKIDVKGLAEKLWTPEKVAERKQQMEEINARFGGRAPRG